MGFWICFNCRSHNVYEKMYVRLNRLACIIDDVEDLMVIEDRFSIFEFSFMLNKLINSLRVFVVVAILIISASCLSASDIIKFKSDVSGVVIKL